jgi:hypothetical protein
MALVGDLRANPVLCHNTTLTDPMCTAGREAAGIGFQSDCIWRGHEGGGAGLRKGAHAAAPPAVCHRPAQCLRLTAKSACSGCVRSRCAVARAAMRAASLRPTDRAPPSAARLAAPPRQELGEQEKARDEGPRAVDVDDLLDDPGGLARREQDVCCTRCLCCGCCKRHGVVSVSCDPCSRCSCCVRAAGAMCS